MPALPMHRKCGEPRLELNGPGSYGGGCYVDLRILPVGTVLIILDFNCAYNPSYAYSHACSCPVFRAENCLAVAVPAGVQSDH